MKLKCPNLLKPLDTIIQENHQPFYPSEPFRILRFQMRHPVGVLTVAAFYCSLPPRVFSIFQVIMLRKFTSEIIGKVLGFAMTLLMAGKKFERKVFSASQAWGLCQLKWPI